ncbi:MAG: hypothetical protein K6F50_07725 [Kiritimatiellae bacterium]|nr:hypothetical protein [Kiritimatiellia bacterium]
MVNLLAALSITGVVTAVTSPSHPSFVIAPLADPNGRAVYVAGSDSNDNTAKYFGERPPKSGDIVEVRGSEVPLFFKPGILAKEVRLLGSTSLPPAPGISPAELRTAKYDNMRCSVEGVVRRVWTERGHVRMTLGTPDGIVAVRLPGNSKAAKDLVDCDVRITGIAMSEFNHRAEFMGFWIEAQEEGAVEAAERREAGHRTKATGVVTAADPKAGVFYLDTGVRGEKVKVEDGNLPEPGEKVEVLAYRDGEKGVLVLNNAEWSSLGRGDIPKAEPFEIGSKRRLRLKEGISFVDQQFRLVSVSGRLGRFSDGRLSIKVNDEFSMAFEDPGDESEIADLADLEPLIEAEGVCDMEVATLNSDGVTYGLVKDARLLAYSPKAVRIIRDSVYRRNQMRRYLAAGLLALLPALAVALAAALWLRLRMRRERMKAAVIEADRKRIAADLHDTVEQYLACAKMVLSGAAQGGEMSPSVRDAFNVAAEVLGQAKREVRDAVMNLQVATSGGVTLETLLRDAAKRVSKSGAASVRLMLRGIPSSWEGPKALNASAIVNEAITNAIKHGKAKTIIIVADPREGGGFILRVRNDGEPFKPSAALGPATGHFGLSGMSERAKRIGGKFTIFTDGKWTEAKLEVFK